MINPVTIYKINKKREEKLRNFAKITVSDANLSPFLPPSEPDGLGY